MKTFDVLTFGSLTLDTFVVLEEMEIEKHKKENWMALPIGSKIKMHTKSRHTGGSAANVSTGLAHLKYNAGVYGTVGDDNAGNIIQHLLEKKGVDTRGLSVQKKTPSSSSIIIMTPDGQQTVLHERTTHAHFEHFPHNIPQTKILYIGHLAREEYPLFDHLAEWKKTNPEGKIVWNPGKTQFRDGFARFKKVYPLINTLILNAEELSLFTEKKESRENNAKQFINAGIKSVIITDGKDGAHFVSQEKTFFQPTLDKTPPVCSLGAGDAFSVGVLAALLEDKDGETQLLWGTRSAESVIREFGAQQGQITRTELEK